MIIMRNMRNMRELGKFIGGFEHFPIMRCRGISRMGMCSKLNFVFTVFVRL